MGWCNFGSFAHTYDNCATTNVVPGIEYSSIAINGATASAVRFYRKNQSLRKLLTALAVAPFIGGLFKKVCQKIFIDLIVKK